MLGLEIDFVAGRYHATPWRHQVNEGVVEWPPSPWRLLRALLAGWYRLAEPDTELVARGLVARLASSEPVYEVPPWTEGHTRHYMPTDDKPTLVFDAFVALDRAAAVLRVGYPGVELTDEEHGLLEQIVQQVRYLGRAESWAEVRAIAFEPGEHVLAPGRGPKVLSLRSPLTQEAYAAWRKEVAPGIPQRAFKPPPDLWAALTMSTSDLQRARWSEAPGSRQVSYDATELKPVRPARRATKHEPSGVRVARFALKPRGGLLPLFTKAVDVADAFHQKLARMGDGAHIPLLVGRDEQDRMLRDRGHAYVFATDETSVGRDRDRVTHLHVALPWRTSDAATAQGERRLFSVDEVEVLRRMRSFYVKKGDGERQYYDLLLEGLWTPGDVDALKPAPLALQEGRVWQSRTPVVLLRHPKVRADGSYRKDGPIEQVERYLRQAGFPEPVSVEPFLEAGDWLSFQRWRRQRREKLPLRHRGFGFTLRFSEPVRGPIAVGYAAHLGLGRFEPILG